VRILRNVKEPEERKKEIIDTAERLFFAKGYAKTKIADIIDEMGMSKGIFYYYFNSKEEVMDAIITRVIDEDVLAVKAVASNDSLSAHEKVSCMLMAHRAKITENDRRFIEQIQDVENPEMLLKTVQQAITRLSPILAEAVEQGIWENVFKTEYPNETIEFLLSAYTFQCLFGESESSKSSVKATERAKAFIRLLERALCAEKGSFDYLFKILLVK
jgi:AcrR family transcriptional regulator